jgi:hypothetical protein
VFFQVLVGLGVIRPHGDFFAGAVHAFHWPIGPEMVNLHTLYHHRLGLNTSYECTRQRHTGEGLPISDEITGGVLRSIGLDKEFGGVVGGVPWHYQLKR